MNKYMQKYRNIKRKKSVKCKRYSFSLGKENIYIRTATQEARIKERKEKNSNIGDKIKKITINKI